jgi:uncharacterized membrane protein
MLRFIACALAAWAVLFTGRALARPEVRYRITPLQTDLATRESEILHIVDLNDKGEVLLERFDGRQQTFLWRAGELIDLTDRIDPNSNSLAPAGMNDKGAIVATNTVIGVLFRKNRVVPIDFGTAVVQPFDINDRGQILGITDFPEHPGEENFLLKGKKVTVLDPLPGDFGTHAIALNDRGAVTGQSSGTDSVHAVIWERDTVMEIPTPRPAFTAFGLDINNRNQVVGGFDGRDGSHEYFLWSDGDMTLLKSASADRPSPVAVSINDCGDMVGTSILAATPPAQWIATIWRNTVPLDLNSLVSDADPLKPFVKMIEAFNINNAGQIVGVGIDSRIPQFQEHYAYLLTPVRARGHKGISKCHR